MQRGMVFYPDWMFCRYCAQVVVLKGTGGAGTQVNAGIPSTPNGSTRDQVPNLSRAESELYVVSRDGSDRPEVEPYSFSHSELVEMIAQFAHC